MRAPDRLGPGVRTAPRSDNQTEIHMFKEELLPVLLALAFVAALVIVPLLVYGTGR